MRKFFSLHRYILNRLASDPKNAIPAVLFSLMLVTIIFLGEPPYAVAEGVKPGNTAKAEHYCQSKDKCNARKNRG
ncbi:hypothetical protein [Aestuariibacter sp. A3R04]|uniref:hypothetical protein n=1 Tax=Aestuariibacter sp. A3R04 TaxID=2841571 RepID=UPI001C082001|nr:hypothetical protein [Aestuariibacter sp. A3R04]MBU3020922.1 hypothetical protein [Aestuariibacter sp. A3R04]